MRDAIDCWLLGVIDVRGKRYYFVEIVSGLITARDSVWRLLSFDL